MLFKRGAKKTSFKDEKFGFGGRKKRSKYNTADSYAEAYKNPVNKKKMSSAKGGKSGGKSGGKKFMNKNKPKKVFNRKK